MGRRVYQRKNKEKNEHLELPAHFNNGQLTEWLGRGLQILLHRFESYTALKEYEVMNFMKNLLVWLRVLIIRVPKEIWYGLKQLYYDERLR